jgi:hypothetical protein
MQQNLIIPINSSKTIAKDDTEMKSFFITINDEVNLVSFIRGNYSY